MVNFGRNAPPIAVVLASLVLWGSFAWGMPADAPAAEGEAEVAREDPWAGVRISDAYDYAKCPNCGKKNEVQAESCARCGYELPQPAAEMEDPGWVFVPGKGYYRDGTILESAKTIRGLWISGLVFSVLGISTISVALIWTSETGGVGPAFYAGVGATAVGAALVVAGVAGGTKPVYAFANGEHYEPYDRATYARRSPDSEGVGLKIEVTMLSF